MKTVPHKLEMDFSRILNKPFLVGTYDWAATNNALTPINAAIPIPSGIILNSLARVPFESAVYFRAKICLMLQVAGTPLHFGTLIASVQPKGVPFTATGGIAQLHSVMCAPHVFLSANQATPACLEVPFYCSNRLARCDLTGLAANSTVPSFYGNGNDYAQLQILVLNPLSVSNAGSSTVSVSVHVIFQELEFYVPHSSIIYSPLPTTFLAAMEEQIDQNAFKAEGFADSLRTVATTAIDNTTSGAKKMAGDFFDVMRSAIRQYTGLHNPNIPKIDHKMYTVNRNHPNQVDTPTRYEKLDPYGDFDRIASEPLFMTTQDEMDIRFLTSKPAYITTIRVNTADTTGKLLFARPITPVMSSAISTFPPPGEHLLAVVSRLCRYWRGTLKLHIQSSMSNFHYCKLLVSLNYYPTVDALTKQPAYQELQNLITTALEFSAGGQIQTIDMPYCSQFNQLDVPTDRVVEALQHGIAYIHLMQPIALSGNSPGDINFNVYLSAGDDFQLYGYTTGQFSGQNVPRVAAFKAEAASATNVPDQCALEINKVSTDESKLNKLDMRPVTNLRDIVRRMYIERPRRYTGDELTTNEGLIYFPVNELVGMRNVDAAAQPDIANPVEVVARMFFGVSGGLKFKFRVFGALDAQVYFVPPGMRGAQTATAISRFMYAGNPSPLLSAIGGAGAAVQLRQGFIDGSGYHFPTPLIECANRVIVSTARTFTEYEQSDYTRNHNSSGFEIEGQIPNMSPFKFVGNAGQFYTSDTSLYDPAGDMGTLILRLQPNKELRNPAEPGGEWINSGVTIVPYIGMTDESRFGFQTILAPTRARVVAGVGSHNFFSIPYGAFISGQQALPANATTVVPGAYFTRP